MSTSKDSESRRRVLVVDDDPDIRSLLITALRMKNIAVDSAHDGHEALELLAQHSYGVVLLDLFMPEIDGFTVLDAIEREREQPVVIVVTGADRSTIERLGTRRIHGVIKKPFDIEELCNVVSSCADLRGRRGLDNLFSMLSGPLFAYFSSR